MMENIVHCPVWIRIVSVVHTDRQWRKVVERSLPLAKRGSEGYVSLMVIVLYIDMHILIVLIKSQEK